MGVRLRVAVPHAGVGRHGGGGRDRAIANTLRELGENSRIDLAIDGRQLLNESRLLVLQLALVLLKVLPLLLQLLSGSSPCCLELHSASEAQAECAVDPGHAFLRLLVQAQPQDAALFGPDEPVDQDPAPNTPQVHLTVHH